MKRSTIVFILTLALAILLTLPVADAQPASKVPRIGMLFPGTLSAYQSVVAAFRQGLRDLGYVEGQGLLMEFRFSSVGDPMGNGFVASLARPGGNVTGLTSMAPELSSKRLELLKEPVPKVSRVATLVRPETSVVALQETEQAAQALGLQVLFVKVRELSELETIFQAATRAGADALIILPGPFTNRDRKGIVDLAAKHRLPAIYEQRAFVEVGGLMTYAPNLSENYRRAAVYVDKILKGAKPGDLPVERPVKFELVINLKTAKALRLTIPPALLFQADEVIR